jgi:hypothetical protein
MRERYEEFGMKLSFARHDGSRRLLVCVAASLLAGCTLIPGNQNYGNREESDVRLPVQQGDLLAPANIKIRPITAELIIDMFQAARPPIGDGTSSAEGGGEGQSAFSSVTTPRRCPSTGSVRATSSRSSSGITLN